jgi:hypothetical protein
MEKITGSRLITLMKTRVWYNRGGGRFKGFSKAVTISDVFCYVTDRQTDNVIVPAYMQMFCGSETAPSHVV